MNDIYWSGAFVVTTAAVLTAWGGFLSARRGRWEEHRRRMTTATGLLLAFLASYPLKLAFLGREDLSSWSRLDILVLRIHETFIAGMLLTGALAIRVTWRRRREPLGIPPEDRRRHRLWGRLAIVAGSLALLTAAFVLAAVWSHA